uniref:Zinc finger, AN1-type domain 3 n=1 Tax=Tetraodon nigroviridis TaxID=99883 RepID=H3C940_TETNG
MGDTSERSKPPSLPPRCPCGFWGSSKTMNLCSKCFAADIQKKQPGEDCTSKPIQSSGSSQSAGFASETSSSSSQSLLSPPPSSAEQPSAEEPSFPSSREGRLDEEAAGHPPHPPRRFYRHQTRQSCARRWRAPVKGELVARWPLASLLSCLFPGYVFCMLHRLPEQHDCLFDHLGRGREEAVLKMVKLDRKVGRSCQRIGEECS